MPHSLLGSWSCYRESLQLHAIFPDNINVNIVVIVGGAWWERPVGVRWHKLCANAYTMHAMLPQ